MNLDRTPLRLLQLVGKLPKTALPCDHEIVTVLQDHQVDDGSLRRLPPSLLAIQFGASKGTVTNLVLICRIHTATVLELLADVAQNVI